MAEQQESALKVPRAKEEPGTGEEQVNQDESAGEAKTDNIDTTSPRNDRTDDHDSSRDKKYNDPNRLYTNIQNAENDGEAIREINKDWEQLKDMINVPNPKDENKTALHISVEKDFSGVVKKFVHEIPGLDISVKDEIGGEPLDYACVRGHTEVMRSLLSCRNNFPIPKRGTEGFLFGVCMSGRLDAVKMICEKYPSAINQEPGSKERSILHWASFLSKPEVISYLIKKGAYIDAKDHNGMTPLMLAVQSKDAERIRILINMKADCNIRDNAGRTALHYAARSSQVSTVEDLIGKVKSETLLVEDNDGTSAFDDFDFSFPSKPATSEQEAVEGSVHTAAVLEALVGRLIDGKKQNDALDWAAQNTKRYRVFQRLVNSLLSKDDSSEASEDNLSVYEWAVDTRQPWVLGLLIDNFPQEPQELGPIERAKLRAASLRKGKKPTDDDYPVRLDKSQADQETQLQKTKLDQENMVLGDIENYLNDFLLEEKYRRSVSKQVKPRDEVDEVISAFQAVITQFFVRGTGKQQHKTRWVKQSRSVKDIIYEEGPSKVADETRKRWFGYLQDEANLSTIGPVTNEIETRLKWIHLPATNIIWMEDITRKILKEKGLEGNEIQRLASFLRSSWVEVPDRTSASRSMRPLYRDSSADEQSTSQDFKRVTAAYIPYFSFSENDIPKHPRQQLTQEQNPISKLLKVYENDALHKSPTLDEAYYHFAKDAEDERMERNKSQVVTDYLKDEADQTSDCWTLIRVKQLWIWTILDEWIITATPYPVDKSQEDDLPKDFLNHPPTQEEIRDSPSGAGFADRIAKLIVNYCVDSYERNRIRKQEIERSERSARSIRQMFSDYVNIITRNEKTVSIDLHNRCGYNTKADDGELNQVLREASVLACKTKDVRDELSILRSIVNHQLRVQKGMIDTTRGSSRITADYYLKDLDDLENVARRAQESVNATLSLVETEIANHQAQEAARQGRTILVFTVVTILFLPLSFLSSLFALDVSSFKEAPGWAFIVIFLASFTFFVLVAPIALFSDTVAKQWHKRWDPLWDKISKHWRDQQKKPDKQSLSPA
ncbi:1-alkyl-2-acetylglycerophosphocholine esterase [Fusarium austroafricanum]|uniref:1-alkyl-2-acetylglycerophosphocholine esterase n=1 Tax=Fusarium austroafricanum TaxID=2364996 RepID=A0A8H4KJJ2_9HYPO|nr:1-alkyl-2-acetylglycerophosphocholine esterase [Fusarium austroafricanum]